MVTLENFLPPSSEEAVSYMPHGSKAEFFHSEVGGPERSLRERVKTKSDAVSFCPQTITEEISLCCIGEIYPEGLLRPSQLGKKPFSCTICLQFALGVDAIFSLNGKRILVTGGARRGCLDSLVLETLRRRDLNVDHMENRFDDGVTKIHDFEGRQIGTG